MPTINRIPKDTQRLLQSLIDYHQNAADAAKQYIEKLEKEFGADHSQIENLTCHFRDNMLMHEAFLPGLHTLRALPWGELVQHLQAQEAQ